MVVRNELSQRLQKYEAKFNLGKICAINFHDLKNKNIRQTAKGNELCNGGLIIIESFYQRNESDQQSVLLVIKRFQA